MARIEKTVFISYRRKDVSWALAVYQDLAHQGYDVFFDYTSIPSGDFEQIIISNINARAHFVLILTPTALDRCSEPGDWLRREIEAAIDQKRNIIPLFFDGFSFGTASVSEKLTGKLRNISRYNGTNVHQDYFHEAMERLRTRFLSVPLDAVIHPLSTEVQKVVKEEQLAANDAILQSPSEKPSAEKKPVIETSKSSPVATPPNKLTISRPLRVFLCYSSNDKSVVRELYQNLRAETWIQPWLDEEELYPGQDWNFETEKAVEAADVIIVCLSKGSTTKDGIVQREIRIALDYADYKPEGTLYVIPVRLEECEPPRRLRPWQYADYFEGQRERGFQRLLVSLKRRAYSLELKVESPNIDGKIVDDGKWKDDEGARKNLIELSLRLGQSDQANAELENYLTYLQTTNRGAQGITFVEELLADRPEDTVLRRALAQLYQQAGRIEDAVAQLDSLAESMLTAGKKVEAMVIINQILLMDPPNANQYRLLLMQLQSG